MSSPFQATKRSRALLESEVEPLFPLLHTLHNKIEKAKKLILLKILKT